MKFTFFQCSSTQMAEHTGLQFLYLWPCTVLSMRWGSVGQCDQMTKFCFPYLAILSYENVPNSIQIVPKWVENFAQNQINLKIFYYLPKCWNFAKSGHTVCGTHSIKHCVTNQQIFGESVFNPNQPPKFKFGATKSLSRTCQTSNRY